MSRQSTWVNGSHRVRLVWKAGPIFKAGVYTVDDAPLHKNELFEGDRVARSYAQAERELEEEGWTRVDDSSTASCDRVSRSR